MVTEFIGTIFVVLIRILFVEPIESLKKLIRTQDFIIGMTFGSIYNLFYCWSYQHLHSVFFSTTFYLITGGIFFLLGCPGSNSARDGWFQAMCRDIQGYFGRFLIGFHVPGLIVNLPIK